MLCYVMLCYVMLCYFEAWSPVVQAGLELIAKNSPELFLPLVTSAGIMDKCHHLCSACGGAQDFVSPGPHLAE